MRVPEDGLKDFQRGKVTDIEEKGGVLLRTQDHICGCCKFSDRSSSRKFTIVLHVVDSTHPVCQETSGRMHWVRAGGDTVVEVHGVRVERRLSVPDAMRQEGPLLLIIVGSCW